MPLPTRSELRTEVTGLLEDLDDDLDQYGGLVENHLNICAIHLRMILAERRTPVAAAPVTTTTAGEDEIVDEKPAPVRRGRARKPGDD